MCRMRCEIPEEIKNKISDVLLKPHRFSNEPDYYKIDVYRRIIERLSFAQINVVVHA
jgi:hypothetical protein